MAEVSIIEESIRVEKISDEEYFALKGYISNSKLGLLNEAQDGSEEKYNQGFDNKYSESFELGGAVHSMLLQTDEFYVVGGKPGGKLGEFANAVLSNRRKGLSIRDSIDLASKSADYYAGKLSETRLKTAIKSSLKYYLSRLKVNENITQSAIYLSDAIKAKYENCMQNIPKSFYDTLYPIGMFAPAESFNEYAIFCDFKVKTDEFETIIKFKAKLDNFTVDKEEDVVVLNDLKTTGKPVGFFMGNNARLIDDDGAEYRKWIDGSFQKYHYHRQMGAYLYLLQYWMKRQGNFKYKANMLVIETIPPFKSKIYPVTNKQIKKGLDEFKELLIKAAKVEWNKTK